VTLVICSKDDDKDEVKPLDWITHLHDFRILPRAFVSLHATTFALASSPEKIWQLAE
jgi:hypothetical protein